MSFNIHYLLLHFFFKQSGQQKFDILSGLAVTQVVAGVVREEALHALQPRVGVAVLGGGAAHDGRVRVPPLHPLHVQHQVLMAAVLEAARRQWREEVHSHTVGTRGKKVLKEKNDTNYFKKNETVNNKRFK